MVTGRNWLPVSPSLEQTGVLPQALLQARSPCGEAPVCCQTDWDEWRGDPRGNAGWAYGAGTAHDATQSPALT